MMADSAAITAIPICCKWGCTCFNSV